MVNTLHKKFSFLIYDNINERKQGKLAPLNLVILVRLVSINILIFENYLPFQ
jgi:hypothetical protein